MIASYFKKINLKGHKSQDEFWEHLYKNHNKRIVTRLKALVEQRAQEGIKSKPDDLYTIKNSNLKLSIDFSSYSTDLYKAFLKKFSSLSIQAPQTILDVGCDNGIVTCYYAILYPEAQVIGIDPCENSIKCAAKLAKKLGLKNISFIKTKLEELKEQYPLNYFDLITSIRTFHEIVPLMENRYWSVNELKVHTTPNNVNLAIVRNFLKNPESRFATCERLPSFADYAWWIYELRGAGLYVEWAKRDEINFDELGEEQSMPFFVATTGFEKEIPYQEIQQFYAGYPDTNNQNFTYFQDVAAEIAFNQIGDKSIICGTQINYADGLGDLRIELWENKEKILFYQCSNVGFRELQIYPQSMKTALIKKIDSIKSLQANTENITYFYNSLMERNELTSTNPVG